jgi:DNA-binding transcriptional MocR family regulator
VSAARSGGLTTNFSVVRAVLRLALRRRDSLAETWTATCAACASATARRDTLLEALARRLPDARVEGIAAGLYALVLLPAGVNEAALLASAAERDVGMEGLGWDRSDPRGRPPGLLLGYANLSQPSIDNGIHRIAEAVAAVAR